MQGIYTLANDAVCDQLAALLNSVEANYSRDMPVCVIPYDDNLARVREEIAKRPQVTLFDDKASIARWEAFVKDVWSLEPKTADLKPEIWGRHKLGIHRKLCCFDGPFERFIFLDADTLVMDSLDFVFKRLDRSDFIVYDFQHKDVSHVYNTKSTWLYRVFPKERIDAEIFCTGFFASKRGLFDGAGREQILSELKAGDAEILYPRSADQSIMNYMVMKTGAVIHNFALEFSREERTGNAVTSTHFEEKDNVLYDKGKRLTYLHYIGIPSSVFRQICAGENIALPYRDIFLRYRYLYEPEKRPVFRGKPRPYIQPAGLGERIAAKLKNAWEALWTM